MVVYLLNLAYSPFSGIWAKLPHKKTANPSNMWVRHYKSFISRLIFLSPSQEARLSSPLPKQLHLFYRSGTRVRMLLYEAL